MSQQSNEAPEVAFLGPHGTYSHQAALKWVGEQDAKLVACSTIKETIEWGRHRSQMLTPPGKLVVVPISNSVQGPVTETLISLGNSNLFGESALQIIDELDLTISHALVVSSGTRRAEEDLSRIRVVRSHPQALGQCSGFISSHLPHAIQEETNSTAEAVTLLDSEDAAAIASELSAKISGAQVLFRGIQNSSENVTRFFVAANNAEKSSVLTPLKHIRDECQNDRTVLRSLYRIRLENQSNQSSFERFTNLDPNLEVENIHAVPGCSSTFLLEVSQHSQNENSSISLSDPTSMICNHIHASHPCAQIDRLGTWYGAQSKRTE
ncbi:prephenate dehydratase [Malassezia psittaci]|uniref:Prephenate dehydratase n=1 Tax=Malassezia psittaci TaxID=1821823 RepID=A0AAF0F5G1_9BASI|nr:prephenate dehydratase [Malassezia psittaci]